MFDKFNALHILKRMFDSKIPMENILHCVKYFNSTISLFLSIVSSAKNLSVSYSIDSIRFHLQVQTFVRTEKNGKLFVGFLCSFFLQFCVQYKCICSTAIVIFCFVLKCFQWIVLLSYKAYPFSQFQ